MIALCLLPSLSGCATDPVIVTKTERERVPDSLTVSCPKSELSGDTYQAAIELAINRGKDVDECNSRLEDIRKWSAQ